jgi:hypothetical protein
MIERGGRVFEELRTCEDSLKDLAKITIYNNKVRTIHLKFFKKDDVLGSR